MAYFAGCIGTDDTMLRPTLKQAGVVSSFTISEVELNYWLKGKNALCDYLVQDLFERLSAF